MKRVAASAAERVWKVSRGRPKAVEEARHFAELAVARCDSEGRRATVMAVSEFAENLLKYSADIASSNAGTIALSIHPGVIRIRVTNKVVTSEDARHVQETIASLAASADTTSLYRTRLEKLLQDPLLPRARLGLLRMAAEGAFRLSCSFDSPLLEIIAERSRGGAR